MADRLPPGWYPDLEVPGSRRYWDGAEWVGRRVPLLSRGEERMQTWLIVAVVLLVVLAAAVWKVAS